MKKKIVAVISVLMLLCLLSGCGLTVERPEEKSGEFNFSVTYKYNGETKNVSGVYVCEYADLNWTLDGGYHRAWSGYIKGGDDNDFVAIDTVNGSDEIILVLNLNPSYFMGDYNADLYDDVPAPYIMIKNYGEDGALSVIHKADEVERICGAKMLSYEYDAPIENSFSIFN